RGGVARGVPGPVPSKRAADEAHPDGAEPPRSSARVPRGPGTPLATPPRRPPIGRSRHSKRWRDRRPGWEKDPDRGATPSVRKPGGLSFESGSTDEALPRLLARGLVVLAGAELARDRVVVREHEGGEARVEELGFHDVLFDEAARPVAVDRVLLEPVLERRIPAGPDADGHPRRVERGRLDLDADAPGLVEHQQDVDIAIDVGPLDRRRRRRKAEHAERPRQRD